MVSGYLTGVQAIRAIFLLVSGFLTDMHTIFCLVSGFLTGVQTISAIYLLSGFRFPDRCAHNLLSGFRFPGRCADNLLSGFRFPDRCADDRSNLSFVWFQVS